MSPIASASVYLLQLIGSFFLYLFVLRLWLQKFRAHVFNPVSQFVIKCTNPIIKPLRFVLPGVRGFDLAVVFMLCLTQWVLFSLVTWISFGVFPAVGPGVLHAVSMVVMLNCNFFVIVVIISAIVSWFPQLKNSPFVAIVNLLAQPLLSVVRRYVPLIGGVDVSPLVVIVGIHLLSLLVISPLNNWIASMF